MGVCRWISELFARRVIFPSLYKEVVYDPFSGITSGSVLNGELYAQRSQKLMYLHLLTDCFMKISLYSSEQNFALMSEEKCHRVIITSFHYFICCYLHPTQWQQHLEYGICIFVQENQRQADENVAKISLN